MVKKYFLICLLVTCQQNVLTKSTDDVVSTTPKVFVSIPNQSNGSDGSIANLPLAQALTSGDIASDLSSLWTKAELLPLNDEDFPMALYSSSLSSSSSVDSVKESTDNSVTEQSTQKPAVISSSDDISSSEVLKRVGWSGDQSRYSGETKGWSKQISVGQSMGSSGVDKSGSAQPSHNIQPINNHQSDDKSSSASVGSGPGPTNMEMVDLTAAATSNNYEVPSSGSSSSAESSSSSGGSSSNGVSVGSNGGGSAGRYSSYNSDNPRTRTRYGFRVSNSRHREPEFSSSSNYDDFAPPDYPSSSSGPGSDSSYADSYEQGPPPPPPSGSSGSGEDYRSRIPDNERHGPSHDMKHSDGPSPPPPPPPPPHTHDTYDRDVPQRPKYSGYRPRYRTKQHFMSSSASWPEFSEWDSPSSSDRGWLSSLFGSGGSSSGYKSSRPSRYRSPFGLTSSAEIPLTSLPSSFFDDAIPYYKPHTAHHTHPHGPPPPSAPIHSPMPQPRPSTWFSWTGAGLRPQASTFRPSYSFGGYGYGGPAYGPRPLMSTGPPPPPSPYSYSYGALPSSSSMMPVSVRSPFTFGSMMSSPSMSYPLKMAYTSPYTSGFAFRSPYPMYRPFLPSNDLAFAESFRKPNTSEKMEGSASQSAMAFASPPSPGSPPQPQSPPSHPQIPMLAGPNGGLFNSLSFVNRPGSNGLVDPIFNFFNPGPINPVTEKPAESSGSSSSSSSSSSSTEGTTASPVAKKNTGLFSGLRKIF